MSEKTERLFAIRGASGAENTKDSIIKSTGEMCEKIFKSNNLTTKNIVCVQFTLTSDLNVLNPASALRLFYKENRASYNMIDISLIPLFCSQEPQIQGSPSKMIRVLVTAYLSPDSKIKHVYINGAEKLRPDFAEN